MAHRTGRGLTGLLFLASGIAAAADYAGARVCQKCHQSEYESQSSSAHARALAAASQEQPGDWAFGAGTQAITFVSRVDRETYREHGETWYRASNGYSLTPGHRRSGGILLRLFDPAARILRCFACHSTGTLTLGAENEVVPQELGIRCEVCHGPAADHANDPSHSRPRNPGTMSASELNTFCSGCHNTTGALVPGSNDLRDSRNARSQPLRLAASACFQKSEGRLSCLTCHSPHEPLERRAGKYDATCQSCHRQVAHTTAVAGQNCVKCHMPSFTEPDLVFTNHRIATYDPKNPLLPVNAKLP
jgi:hypothetical protein